MENGERIRIGFGYDVHAFLVGRKLILGGVDIPFDRGLAGHSDADVIIHAVCDAILGAAGLGDIGRHFPDTDPDYKDISSLILLARVVDIVREHNFRIGNIDVTVVAQAPRLAPYIESMITKICDSTGLSKDIINIKATTTEGLGFVGRKEGIAAYAVALIIKIPGRVT